MTEKKVAGLGGLPQANIFDPIPDFTKIVHVRENNSTSEAHLNENRRKFTGDCAIVLSLLQKGHVISTKSVYMQWNVSSLPRRIKDLRDEGGIHIDEQSITGKGGKSRNKIWFMREHLSEETAIRYKIEWKKK